VDAATKPDLFRTWYAELTSFDKKSRKHGPLPHLGTGTVLVTALVSSFFVSHLASAFAVIVAYGPHAYFREGLYISDWKHDLLSSGAYLSFMGKLVEIPTTLILWAATIYAADLCSMLIQQIIHRKGRWTGMAFRLVGGSTLLTFAAYLYRQGGWGLHPVPLSALIGGAVLVWKAFASIFAKSIEPEI